MFLGPDRRTSSRPSSSGALDRATMDAVEAILFVKSLKPTIAVDARLLTDAKFGPFFTKLNTYLFYTGRGALHAVPTWALEFHPYSVRLSNTQSYKGTATDDGLCYTFWGQADILIWLLQVVYDYPPEGKKIGISVHDDAVVGDDTPTTIEHQDDDHDDKENREKHQQSAAGNENRGCDGVRFKLVLRPSSRYLACPGDPRKRRIADVDSADGRVNSDIGFEMACRPESSA